MMLLMPSNMTYTYDNSGHGNDDGKVNYVADNKMPKQGEAIKPGTEPIGTCASFKLIIFVLYILTSLYNTFTCFISWLLYSK